MQVYVPYKYLWKIYFCFLEWLTNLLLSFLIFQLTPGLPLTSLPKVFRLDMSHMLPLGWNLYLERGLYFCVWN